MSKIIIPCNYRITGVAFSPDSKYVASSAINDHTIRVWNATSGKIHKMLIGHKDSCQCVAFSPDSVYLASGSDDETVKVWHVTRNQCVHTLSGVRNTVLQVGFSPDGHYLAALGEYHNMSDDRTLMLWTTNDYTWRRRLRGTAYKFSFCNDGLRFLTSTRAGVCVWNLHTQRLQDVSMQNECARSSASISFSPDGVWWTTADDCFRVVTVSHVQSGKQQRQYMGLTEQAAAVVFSSDGRYLAAASRYQNICVWDFERRVCVRKITRYTRDDVTPVPPILLEFSPCLTRLVATSFEKTIEILSIVDLALVCKIAATLLPRNVAPYTLLDIVDFLFADLHQRSFDLESRFFHLNKIRAIERVQHRLKHS
jgi:WD40 repeat protein